MAGKRIFHGFFTQSAIPLLAITLLAALHATPLAAQTVYRAINPDGTVSFSDTPPSHTRDYEEIQLEEYPPSDPEAQRRAVEAMTATSNRLQADRQAREKARQEEQARQQRPVIYRPQPAAPERDDPYYRHPYYPPYAPYPQPPYREERLPNTRDSLLDRARTPIGIPRFGTDESFRERHGR